MDPISKALAQVDGGNTERNDRTKGLRPPWKPGQSGNPSGRPRKARITKIYERILASADTRKGIEEAIINTLTGDSRMASVLMLREMAERTEGRVTQPVELSGSIGTMSDEQVDERLTKLLDLDLKQHESSVIDIPAQSTQDSTHEPERDTLPAK
jgi:hypothetical protein